ncbi:MAG: type II secretion system protein F [Acidimicrobiia bacterium]|nr:type II secretion system protein F [Acidimicrobiia bacterium]
MTLPTLEIEVDEVVTVVESAPVPAPREGEIVALSWWDTEQALWVGVGALFLAIASTLSMMSLPKPVENVLRADPHRLGEYRPSALSSLASSATNLAETTLTKADRLTPLNAALEQAGLVMRPAEFVVLVLSGAVIAGAVGMLFAGWAMALAFAAAVLALAKLRLGSLASQRSQAFADQLVDSLQLMASSMRAGYGLLQAVDSVAAEAPAPASEEFQRIKVETQLGREVEDSMRAAADRVQSDDFRMVAESIEIHRQIGGDLAEILDAVNETIRDRNRIRRRIRALSAEGRISGIVLSVIPIVLVIAISFLNPGYLGELTGSPIGRLIIVLGIVAWLIAVVWIRRLVRLVF